MNIKVLGTGCMNCVKLYEVVQEAIVEMNKSISLEKVEDLAEIMSYGVMKTPALVIDDEVVLQGKIPTKVEVMRLIEENDISTFSSCSGNCSGCSCGN